MSRRDLKNSSGEKKERTCDFKTPHVRGAPARRRLWCSYRDGRARGRDPRGRPRALRRAARGGTVCGHGERRRVPRADLEASSVRLRAVPPSNDAATTIEVVGPRRVRGRRGVVLDWAPARGAETTRHVAVEARAKDDVAHALGAVGRARARARADGAADAIILGAGSGRPARGKAAASRRPPCEKADCATARRSRPRARRQARLRPEVASVAADGL